MPICTQFPDAPKDKAGTSYARPTIRNNHTICFTSQTQVLTPMGERPIGHLSAGDKVITRDGGLQKIRWAGRRQVVGKGALAPIRIASHVLPGARRDLLVSPQHRLLLQGAEAQRLFGESEVFATAEHLVNGHDVTREEMDEVTYVHIMFDGHEVIYSEGVASESFHADDAGLGSIPDAAREELFTIFPELRSWTGGHGRSARRCLTSSEAAVLSESLIA